MTALVLTLAVGISSALVLASCRLQAPGGVSGGAVPVDVGDPLPELEFSDAANGGTVTLPGDMEGRPFALLYFSYG